VPRTGQSARLTVFTSAAMAFLAVFALALSLASGRLADRWSSALAQSSTIRLSAPPGEIEAQTWAVLRCWNKRPASKAPAPSPTRNNARCWSHGSARICPSEDLPVPRLIEIVETPDGYDATGLRQRLAAEAPGAVLDDHTRWREPLAEAAGRLRLLGWVSLILIAGAMGALITLAAQAALSANAPVIRVLRLVGARDAYIARAFVRRFTVRALERRGGRDRARDGRRRPAAGLGAKRVLPDRARVSAGPRWLLPVPDPAFGGVVAFAATRIAAYRTLRGLNDPMAPLPSLRGQMYAMMPVLAVFYTPWAIVDRRGAFAGIHAYTRWVRWTASWMVGLKTEVRGTPPTGEVLIASKHQSFLDIIMIVSVVPRPEIHHEEQSEMGPHPRLVWLRIGCVPWTGASGPRPFARW
jgi:cell division transport system permease protein